MISRVGPPGANLTRSVPHLVNCLPTETQETAREKALRRIEVAEPCGAAYLDLSRFQLTAIPDLLSHPTTLQALFLWRIPHSLSRPTNLQQLRLAGNPLPDERLAAAAQRPPIPPPLHRVHPPRPPCPSVFTLVPSPDFQNLPSLWLPPQPGLGRETEGALDAARRRHAPPRSVRQSGRLAGGASSPPRRGGSGRRSPPGRPPAALAPRRPHRPPRGRAPPGASHPPRPRRPPPPHRRGRPLPLALPRAPQSLRAASRAPNEGAATGGFRGCIRRTSSRAASNAPVVRMTSPDGGSFAISARILATRSSFPNRGPIATRGSTRSIYRANPSASNPARTNVRTAARSAASTRRRSSCTNPAGTIPSVWHADPNASGIRRAEPVRPAPRQPPQNAPSPRPASRRAPRPAPPPAAPPAPAPAPPQSRTGRVPPDTDPPRPPGTSAASGSPASAMPAPLPAIVRSLMGRKTPPCRAPFQPALPRPVQSAIMRP